MTKGLCENTFLPQMLVRIQVLQSTEELTLEMQLFTLCLLHCLRVEGSSSPLGRMDQVRHVIPLTKKNEQPKALHCGTKICFVSSLTQTFNENYNLNKFSNMFLFCLLVLVEEDFLVFCCSFRGFPPPPARTLAIEALQ